MANVILFQVENETASCLSSGADAEGRMAATAMDEEATLLQRVGDKAQPIDAVVIGLRARDAEGVAKRLRARDALVSLLLLTPESPSGTELLTSLHACVASARERRLRGELERAEGMRDALLSIVSHDIRAPLSVISGAMSELTHPTVGQLNDEQRMLLALMRRSIDRLGRLASNLSYVAKLESGRLLLVRRRTDLCALAKETARKMQETEDFGDIALQVEVPDAPVFADVDATLIAVVLGNLISNSVRFAKKQITLRVVAAAGVLSLEVEDDGSGIPEVGDDIFERVRLSPKPGGPSGSGLGLAIVRGLTVVHGGSVRAENRKGADGRTSGARFIVTLPPATT